MPIVVDLTSEDVRAALEDANDALQRAAKKNQGAVAELMEAAMALGSAYARIDTLERAGRGVAGVTRRADALGRRLGKLAHEFDISW